MSEAATPRGMQMRRRFRTSRDPAMHERLGGGGRVGGRLIYVFLLFGVTRCKREFMVNNLFGSRDVCACVCLRVCRALERERTWEILTKLYIARDYPACARTYLFFLKETHVQKHDAESITI